MVMLRNLLASVVITLGLLFSCAGIVSAATIPEGTGFIQKNIWYSKYPLADGETVRIYTLINNPANGTLAGTATFYDKEEVLGSKQFSISKGGYGTVFIEWKVAAGDHAISAKITKAKIGTSEVTDLPNITTGVDQTFVPAAVVPPPPTPQKTATATKNTNNDSSTVEKFINEKTPIGGWLGSVDEFRIETADHIDKNIVETKKEIAGTDASNEIKVPSTATSTVSSGYITKDTGTALKKPFSYIKLFFWQTAHFIFDNKIVFYIVIGLFFFVLIKRIVQSFL